MNKNVCIIHFNTPVLTEHLVKSINKHTPGTKIYIFDNSDKRPFVNKFNNVTVFDNTKGQFINFNQWLKKYPNKDKSGGKANKWGSAKHAYSVEKCMELIGEPFVLLDSDVLVRKDITPLFDEVVCYKGEVIKQPKSTVLRVLPFICFINTEMCKKYGIHYFDENYMHGLHVGTIGDRYDTGAALYLLTERKKAPHREIKVADYIVHYGNGSWVDAAEKIRKPKHMPPMDWLNKYKEFWDDEGQNDIKDDVFFTDVFDHIYCLHYLPDNERFENIKRELKRVGIDDTEDYFSWVYDYPSPLLDLLFENKKLNIDVSLLSSSRKYLKNVTLKHYKIIKDAYENGYERILVLEDDIMFHRDLNYITKMLGNIPDTDLVMFDKMISSSWEDNLKYKERIRKLDKDALYCEMDGIFFIFTSCYSINRKAMEHIIEVQEDHLLPTDTIFNDGTFTGSFAVVNLAIQDPKYHNRKVEGYDKIGLDVTQYGEKIPEKVAETKEKVVIAKKTVQKAVVNNNVKKATSKKEAIKPRVSEQIKRPTIKKNVIKLDKVKHVHTRTLYTTYKKSNKLYDMF